MRFYPAIFLIFLFLNSCQKENQIIKNKNIISYVNKIKENPDLEIKLEKKFTLTGGSEFRGMPLLDIDKFGNIYVYDFNSIQKFNSKGEYLKEFSGIGSGPGEFTVRGFFIVADTLIYAADMRGKKVNIFNLEGQFKRSLDFNYWVFPYNVNLWNGCLYVQELNNSYLENPKKVPLAISKFKIVDNKFNKVKLDTLAFGDFHSLGDILLLSGQGERELLFAMPSKDSYQISGYDIDLEKNIEINKFYIPRQVSEEDKGIIQVNNNKIMSYYNAILAIFVDKYQRIWVLNSSGNKGNFFFDIFEDYLYQNTINLTNFKAEESKFEIYKNIFFKGDYLFYYDQELNQIIAYGY